MTLSLGDYPTGATLNFKWSTNAGDGASITRSTNGTLAIYKDDLDTQRASLAGVLQTEDFDGVTGVHHITIALADNTDPGFYAAGSEYDIVMVGMVIDTKTVNAPIAHFSIERAGGVLALLKTVKVVTDALPNDGGLTSLASQTSVTTLLGYVDTEVTSLLTATAAIQAKTDALPVNPANETTVQASLAIVAAYIDTEVAAIKAKTDLIPATPTATGDAMTLTAGERTAIAAALLDLVDAIEAGLTPRQALRLLAAACAGKASGLATTTATYRNAVADSKNRLVAAVDGFGNRTAITYDLST